MSQDGVMKLCLNALKRIALCLPGLRPETDAKTQSEIATQQQKIESLENQFKQQQALIESLERQLAALKKLICAGNPNADICRQP